MADKQGQHHGWSFHTLQPVKVYFGGKPNYLLNLIQTDK